VDARTAADALGIKKALEELAHAHYVAMPHRELLEGELRELLFDAARLALDVVVKILESEFAA